MSGPREPRTYERARRRKVARRLAEAVKLEDTQELLPLDEVTRRLRVFNQSYVGIRTIPIERIIGTVDRSRDFDRDFLPRRADIAGRWRRVESAFPEGDFPPIVVYEVDGAYFLVDGHHRVAIARQRGMEMIDAEVTQLRTRYHLPPDADIAQVIHSEQQGIFMEESGLSRSRPEAVIEFSRPQGYPELFELIKAYGFDLAQSRAAAVPPEEVSADWYDSVYLPAIEDIHREGLNALFPEQTDGDLYLKVYQWRRALFPERGAMDFVEAVRTVRDTERERRRRLRRAANRLRPFVRPDDVEKS
jgi:hypothetical protein